MQIIAKPINFLKEVKTQLVKVSWPTREELIGATAVVIFITIVAAIFVGIIDLVLTRLVSLLFR